MKRIDEPRLETDLEYRVAYYRDFVGFDAADEAALHAAAAHLGPRVASLVDAVYDKLFSYDATKRHFAARQAGYEGKLPGSLQDLTVDHEIIQFRKEHLARYLEALVTRPYDAAMWSYLDMVGKIHTPRAGNPQLEVPLVQMNALLGFVADALMATILELGLPADAEVRTLRAVNKLLWLQSDLIARHYGCAEDVESAGRSLAV